MSITFNRDYLDKLITKYINENYDENIFKEMATYCLFDGKGVRPLIIKDIYDNAANTDSIICDNLMVSIELLHTASLILDDMPFMDDDTTRRGKPCLHVAYSIDSSKKLVSTFINHSIRLIYDVVNDNESIKNVLDILQDTTFGQYIDLFNKIPQSADTYKKCELLCLKTSTLFNLAFLFGAVSCGFSKTSQSKFIEMGSLFGKLFQISDDFEDCIEDLERGRKMNHVNLLGRATSLDLFNEFKSKLENKLTQSSCYSIFFAKLIEKMSSRI